MFFQHAVMQKLEHWAEDIRHRANISLRADLWGEHQLDFGHFDQPSVTLTVRHPDSLPLLLSPSLASLGQLYVEGKLDIDGPLHDAIRCAYALAGATLRDAGALLRAVKHFSHLKQEDKRAIQYHYDVSNDFYRLWLDDDMVYSCAYFEEGNENLDLAQRKKIDHILTKIRLRPGQTLLDIGCGWGALVLRAAGHYGARCVGITLSENQYRLARERVAAAGLQDRVEIRLQDYRDVDGHFDRITSVGMFEHVGRKHLTDYFKIVRNRLSAGGIALNHGITSTDPEGGETRHGGGDFIDKYVFPQGELPHLSQVVYSMQQAGLETFDIENLRRHYARTLTHWSDRYEAQSEDIAALVDEKTFRIWRVYLAGCAHAFDIDQVSIYQIVCSAAEASAQTLPWSRRYIYPAAG
ncbi:SAM-dependent methyltransferase [Paludibacterium yongneupense]|uniref:SAM-dependent methyltransferase n=1 Tax=Paludibacterium yongneupense TaxID=400061 RepID=UPI0003FFF842|nr:cyclopropane-fatty-acyl-phospholipid synthase family protein [Paludibacterium yongneupense]